MLNMAFFGIQGQVTPKWNIRSDQISNSSEILWLSWLSESLKKIRLKVNTLSSGKHFLHYKYMGNLPSLKGDQFDLAWNRTRPRFDEDLIKKKKKLLSSVQPFPHYKSMGVFRCHGNQSIDPACAKTFCSISPIYMYNLTEFGQLASVICKFESENGR